MKPQVYSNAVNGANLRVPRIPIEWYGNNSWRLPSGQALAEFALQTGFLAPLLFKTGMLTATNASLAKSVGPIRRSKQIKKAGHP